MKLLRDQRYPKWFNWLIPGLVVLLLLSGIIVVVQRVRAAQNPPQSAQEAAYQEALKEGVSLGNIPAPAFSLPDQTGTTISLAQLHGHPTVLTFFDSVCPHADCSLIAEYINWTAKDMGVKSADVNWVALSIDPWHDTPATAKTFLSTRQVTIPLHYLLGNLAQMTPLWQGYHMQAILQPDGVVVHTTGIYVLDAQGRENMFFDEGFDPQALSAYLLHMLAQPGNTAGAAATAGAGQPTGTSNQSRTVNGMTISLTETPGQFGTYTFTATVLGSDGTPLEGAQVNLDLTMTAMPMTPLHVTLNPLNPPVPGSYQAQGVVSMNGQWQVTVHVLPPGAAQPTQTTFTFTAKY